MEPRHVIFSFDASLHKTGYAVMYLDRHLWDYDLIKVSNKIKGIDAVLEMLKKIRDKHVILHSLFSFDVISEVQKYRKTNERANINSLMNLQSVCVGCMGVFPNCLRPYWYYPVQWKGSVPKEIMRNRIVKKFKLPEDTDHNVADAIGIADYHIGKHYA